VAVNHSSLKNVLNNTRSHVYAYEHEFVGFEIWQVKSGTLFDHILVTDDVDEARAFADGYLKQQQTGEKAAREADEKAAKEAAGSDSADSEGADQADDDDDDEEHTHTEDL